MIFNINSTRGQTRFLTCVARVTCLVHLNSPTRQFSYPPILLPAKSLTCQFSTPPILLPANSLPRQFSYFPSKMHIILQDYLNTHNHGNDKQITLFR